MKVRGKKYQAALKLVDTEKVYSLEEAVALVKTTSTVKFDATIDVSFRLNVDPRQADQQVRGTLVLPHGNGKTKKVLAITNNTEAATSAGADIVGGKEIVEKIKSQNWFDFDVIVATPDIAKAIKEIKAGKVEYRVDKQANMHISVARVSFEDAKIVENITALTEALIKARPAAVKGAFFKNAVIHTTMGPGIKFTFAGIK